MKELQFDIATSNIRKKVFILAVLFFMWGMLTVLSLVLKSHIQEIFHLSYAVATLIEITFFSSYLIISLSAGNLIKKIGYKKAIICGWLLACLGCFVFYIAVYLRDYEMFLGALFILAGGITILQVGANLYVVLLGNSKNAASRLTLVQAFNSLGTILGPLFASYVLEYYTNIPSSVRATLNHKDLVIMDSEHMHYPYLYLGILMLLFAVVLLITKIPNIDTSNIEPLNKITSLRKRKVMHFPQLRLGAFAIFSYVGAEVALGNYLLKEDLPVTGLSQYYWGLAMVGRFIGSFILLNYSVRKSIVVSASMSILLILLSIVSSGPISVWFIVFVGLFNSILFPSLFTLGVNGLGKFSIDGSAILIMFIVGGAVIPFNFTNYTYISSEIAFIIPIICYIYIGVYAYRLSKFELRDDLKDTHD